jgi:RNA polymerase sigma factor for flagellar operon FliA
MDSAGIEERRLWEAYRLDGDIGARQQLFFRYVPWARLVARDVYRRVRVPQMDWSDYAQNAVIGLLEAMNRFDPSRGIDFTAYARRRVRGAVFNGLRSFLADSGTHYGRGRWFDRVSSFDPMDTEDTLGQMISTIAGLGLGFLLDADAASQLVEPPADAYVLAERHEMDVLLAAAVASLPDREKLVVTLHYDQDMRFVDIAGILGLTKGRVSQLHKSALERIRMRLRKGSELRQIA